MRGKKVTAGGGFDVVFFDKVLCSVLLSLAVVAAVRAAEPELRLLEQSAAEYLTDAVRLTPVPGSAARDLHLGDRRRVLGPRESAYFSGGTVVLQSESERGNEVKLIDDEGRLLRETTVPFGKQVLAFGETVVTFAIDPHASGFPYALNLISASGSTVIERPQRTVISVRPLEEHLAVDSVGPAKGGPPLTEIFDEAGQVVWNFTGDDAATPRVVARDGVAAAIYAARPESRLRTLARGARSPGSRSLPGVLTDVAFVEGQERLVVWGARDVVLVDLPGLEIVWHVHLEGQHRLLPNNTSSILVAADLLTMITRSETGRGTWLVGATFLDVGAGAVTTWRDLYESEALPTHIKRFRRDQAERLVLPDRVFEISSGAKIRR